MQLVREEVTGWISHLIKLERQKALSHRVCSLWMSSATCWRGLEKQVGKRPQAAFCVPSASSRQVQTPQWTIDFHCLGGCWLLGELSVYCWRAPSLHRSEIRWIQCCAEHNILPGNCMWVSRWLLVGTFLGLLERWMTSCLSLVSSCSLSLPLTPSSQVTQAGLELAM